tara:strand:+ start:327 stop:494 length:168 start_codon:yes stop_codon:yes gene_type:complete
MKAKSYTPKNIDDRARPDGFVFDKIKEEQKTEHNHCGTPECCGQCDTADKGESDG